MSSYYALADFYDELTSNVSYSDRAKYFDSIIKKFGNGGKLLLDLGCGTGRMCEEMAKFGYDVIGADLSIDMLSIAQQNRKGDILYICQDMREIELYNPCDIVISTLDTVNHLINEEDVQKCFNSVYENLNDNGIFAFDTNTLYKHEHIMGNNSFVYDMENVYCVWSSEFDKKTYINKITIDIFEKDGDAYFRSGENFKERAYPTETVKEMLNKAGFTVVGVFDSDSENEPREDSERIIYIARK